MNTFTEQDMKEYAAHSTKAFALNTESNFKHWCKERFEPTKKIIDLSVLIESGIDCEFEDNSSWEVTTIGKLYSLDTSNFLPYVLGSKQVSFKYVRPRMNHKHAWQGGDCPLPEGFIVRVWMRGVKTSSHHIATDLRWSHTGGSLDIIHFEVLRVADGYVMPWESELCIF
jgi:hypothetical protein